MMSWGVSTFLVNCKNSRVSFYRLIIIMLMSFVDYRHQYKSIFQVSLCFSVSDSMRWWIELRCEMWVEKREQEEWKFDDVSLTIDFHLSTLSSHLISFFQRVQVTRSSTLPSSYHVWFAISKFSMNIKFQLKKSVKPIISSLILSL